MSHEEVHRLVVKDQTYRMRQSQENYGELVNPTNAPRGGTKCVIDDSDQAPIDLASRGHSLVLDHEIYN